jgi:hypothetical protein
MTLREATEALTSLAEVYAVPGLHPDVVELPPCGRIDPRAAEAARRHLESALEMARAEVAPALRLVRTADGKGGR